MMSDTVHSPYVEPVQKTIRVRASAERAFKVFTGGMSRWWLSTHTINPTHAAIERVVVEPRPGGRWFEVGVDGSECDWGRVMAWEPPHRLLLAWHIDASFKSNPDLHTEIEVHFVQHGDETDVTLEHRHLERFGEAAAQLQTALGSGWGRLLEEFAAAAAMPESAFPIM